MRISIDILGDITLAFYKGEKNALNFLAEEINQTLGEVDYRVADLESPFVIHKAEAIQKSGPNLKMSKEHIPFFERLKVDAYALANNHIGDFGEIGIKDTINVLKYLHKDYVGTSEIYDSTYDFLRKKIKDIKISFLSVCENEFGVARNGILGVAGYEKENIKKCLEKEKREVDFCIVIFHGGTEYYPFPTPGQVERYRELVDFGADAVIGMHTHCPQGYEIYKEVPIIYSLGNFFFPRTEETVFEAWKVGYTVRLFLEKEKKIVVEKIAHYFDVYGKKFEVIEKAKFKKYLDNISEPIQNKAYLKKLYLAWASMSGKSHIDILRSKILADEKEICFLKNMFNCETHNELLKTYLQLEYDESINEYDDYIKIIKDRMKLETYLRKRQVKNVKIDVFVWGISAKAERLYSELKREKKEVAFIDKDIIKQDLFFLSEDIFSPEKAIETNKSAVFYICTREKFRKDIREWLNEHGIKDEKIKDV